MIAVNKLNSLRTLVTHHGCPDGVASALLCLDALPHLGSDVRFVRYQSREHLEMAVGDGMLFVDFSPPRDRAEEFAAAGAVVLDHHETQRDIVAAFGENGVYADNRSDGDRLASGAVLAFRHVWEPAARDASWSAGAVANARSFAELAGVRDTWRRDSNRWGAACAQAAALLFYPFDDLGRMVHRGRYDDSAFAVEKFLALQAMLDVGGVLLRRRDEEVREAVGEARRFASRRGTRVLAFNSTTLTSDASEFLGADVDLVVGFKYVADAASASVVFSTRSHAGYDCAALCKAYGGGGHEAAAGMTIHLPAGEMARSVDLVATAKRAQWAARHMDPYGLAEFLVDDYETRS